MKPLPPLTKRPDDFTEEDLYDLDANADAIAAALGCIVVVPKSNQIQLDIDDAEAYEVFKWRMLGLTEVLKRVTGDADVLIEEHASKSGLPNRHITITFCGLELTEWQRIAMQFMLGSDHRRESINSLRLLLGVPNPTRLFELKEV